jgi:hypothetical protein
MGLFLLLGCLFVVLGYIYIFPHVNQSTNPSIPRSPISTLPRPASLSPPATGGFPPSSRNTDVRNAIIVVIGTIICATGEVRYSTAHGGCYCTVPETPSLMHPPHTASMREG